MRHPALAVAALTGCGRTDAPCGHQLCGTLLWQWLHSLAVAAPAPLAGTSVASPVAAGAVCLLASTVPEQRRWSVLNPASMKQVSSRVCLNEAGGQQGLPQ